MNTDGQKQKCSFCGKPGVKDIRQNYFYKGVLFEGLPAKRCPNCHEIYYNVKTVRLMDEIAADPEKRTEMLLRPVWRPSERIDGADPRPEEKVIQDMPVILRAFAEEIDDDDPTDRDAHDYWPRQEK